MNTIFIVLAWIGGTFVQAQNPVQKPEVLDPTYIEIDFYSHKPTGSIMRAKTESDQITFQLKSPVQKEPLSVRTLPLAGLKAKIAEDRSYLRKKYPSVDFNKQIQKSYLASNALEALLHRDHALAVIDQMIEGKSIRSTLGNFEILETLYALEDLTAPIDEDLVDRYREGFEKIKNPKSEKCSPN